MTCDKLKTKLDRLWWWEDDGSESEVRNILLADVTSDVSLNRVIRTHHENLVFWTTEVARH